MKEFRVDDIGEILRKENERTWFKKFLDKLRKFKPGKELLEIVKNENKRNLRRELS